MSCDVCSTGSFQSCTQVFSGTDGSFTLNGVPAGMTEIDIQKGRFRRRLHLDVPCGGLALTADQSRLPKNSGEGDIPKIAVANGEWDKLECVHYDFTTCLREAEVLVKSFVRTLPGEQLSAFASELDAVPVPRRRTTANPRTRISRASA